MLFSVFSTSPLSPRCTCSDARVSKSTRLLTPGKDWKGKNLVISDFTLLTDVKERLNFKSTFIAFVESC